MRKHLVCVCGTVRGKVSGALLRPKRLHCRRIRRNRKVRDLPSSAEGPIKIDEIRVGCFHSPPHAAEKDRVAMMT
jgi:hypothetical protein